MLRTKPRFRTIGIPLLGVSVVPESLKRVSDLSRRAFEMLDGIIRARKREIPVLLDRAMESRRRGNIEYAERLQGRAKNLRLAFFNEERFRALARMELLKRFPDFQRLDSALLNGIVYQSWRVHGRFRKRSGEHRAAPNSTKDWFNLCYRGGHEGFRIDSRVLTLSLLSEYRGKAMTFSAWLETIRPIEILMRDELAWISRLEIVKVGNGLHAWFVYRLDRKPPLAPKAKRKPAQRQTTRRPRRGRRVPPGQQSFAGLGVSAQ